MNALLATLAGLGIGAGVVLLILTASGVQLVGEQRPTAGRRGFTVSRLMVAMAAGLLIAVVTKWLVAGVAAALLIVLWSKLFGAQRDELSVIARLEGLAVWTEALRDTIATGSGLLEALRSTSANPPEALAIALQDLSARLDNRESIEMSLRHAADRIDDPIADQVMAALVLNARAQGRQLRAVLTALAASTRKTVETRREITAERKALRRGSVIIVIVTVLMLGWMMGFMPQFAASLTTPVGQVVSAVAMGCFVVGFIIMRQLAVLRTPTRFLLGVKPT